MYYHSVSVLLSPLNPTVAEAELKVYDVGKIFTVWANPRIADFIISYVNQYHGQFES